MRLRYVLRERDTRDRSDEQVLSIYRDLGVVPKGGRTDNFNKTPEDVSNYKLVMPGDVVVNKMKAWQGSIAVSAHQGIVSGDYLVCEVVHQVERRYLHHALRSQPMVAEYRVRSKGIRPSQWRLYWDDLAEVELRLPPFAEQRAIADYLDAETARIDALIEKKRRMIALLDERRASAVQETLLPGSPVADVLVAPAHVGGQLIPLKRLLLGTLPGGTPDANNSEYWAADADETCVNWISIGDMVDRGVTATTSKRLTKGGLAAARLTPGPPGTLLFAMYASLGKLSSTGVPAVWNQAILGLVPDPSKSAGAFLAYWLEALRPHLGVVARSNTQDNLNAEQVGQLPVPVWDLHDQQQIVEKLDRTVGRIEGLAAQLRDQVDLLTERRQALITAAVTGELEVPGVAA